MVRFHLKNLILVTKEVADFDFHLMYFHQYINTYFKPQLRFDIFYNVTVTFHAKILVSRFWVFVKSIADIHWHCLKTFVNAATSNNVKYSLNFWRDQIMRKLHVFCAIVIDYQLIKALQQTVANK